MTEKITRRKLADEVFERLHQSITSGELQPGDKMPSERELMEKFAVGRLAIREALQSLDKLGLIRIAHGERARVTVPTAQNVIDQIDMAARHMISNSDENLEHLKQARLFFETGMVRIAASTATTQQKTELRQLLEEQGNHVGDPVSFVKADIAFHVCIARMSNNPIFLNVARAMLEWLFERHSELIVWTGNEKITLAEHELIASSIEANDANKAVSAITAHLNRSSILYQNPC